jgi:multiple sugar transport system ATP-binding protein
MEIDDGELVVFVGPSGCGKSTLLRMVAGLEDISEGQISIDGERINELSPADRDVAMVFQNYALYPHMTVFGNMAYGLTNRGMPKVEVAAKVRETAKLLNIEEFLERKPAQLSGGQRQRVAMGRAIVRSPKIFLFDEPLSNLDAKLRVQMRIEIRRLQRELNVTSIYVTHDQVEAMTLGDRVVVMRDGWVQQVGTPLEIYNRPSTLFVAGFMGSPPMNFIEVNLREANGHLYAEAADFRVRVPPVSDAALRPYMERPAVLGVRPEHVLLGEPAPENETGFDGGIDVTEQLGSEMLVGVGAAGTEIMMSRVDPQIGLKLHEKVRLSLNPAHLHFFDRDSELAIV